MRITFLEKPVKTHRLFLLIVNDYIDRVIYGKFSKRAF